MASVNSLAVLALATFVDGHGYMWTPKSRTRLGFEAGTDTCPECTILEPVESWPDLDVAPVAQSGICGYNSRVGVDYNTPGASWGSDTVETYAAGDTIDVVWCVDANGDHGGMFTYRICQDQTIIDKFLDPTYIPTNDEKQAAEDCLEQGILPCGDVDGQTCDYSADCSSGEACYNNDWFTCEQFGNGGCIGVDAAPLNSCETTIAGGYIVSKKVKLPDFQSEHTLLSFKWNSFQTGQIYLSCSDIAITAGGAGNGSTPAPTITTSVPSSTSSSTSVPTSTGGTEGCGIAFNVTATAAGDSVAVTGSILKLGNWDVNAAVPLIGSDSTWSATVSVPAGTSFEYKYVKIDSAGAVTWEDDPNRALTVDASCEKTVSVQDTWQ
ncbi:starch binding domain-containing protein [Xylariales sp. AK1849]|nr:starch binding domain-containing protein [Xylariales sp. AK1849]